MEEVTLMQRLSTCRDRKGVCSWKGKQHVPTTHGDMIEELQIDGDIWNMK